MSIMPASSARLHRPADPLRRRVPRPPDRARRRELARRRTTGAGSSTSPRARCARRSATAIRRSSTRCATPSERVVHLFSAFLSRDVTELARELMAVLPAPLARAMFLSTGGEANEAALRLAKLHTGGHEVLAFAGSWHGMTAGAAASTYSAGRRGYGPSMPGTMALPTPNAYRCPIPHCRDRCDFDLPRRGHGAGRRAVGRRAGGGDRRADPQRRAGSCRCPTATWRGCRSTATSAACCWCSTRPRPRSGRVGAMFAFERHGVVPDVLTLSKTLGGGLPLVGDGHHRGDRGGRGREGLPALHLARLGPAAGRGRARGPADGARRRPPGRAAAARRAAARRARGAAAPARADRRRARRGPDARRRPRQRPRDARARRALRHAVTERCLELGLNVNIVKFPGLGSVLRIAPPLTIAPEEIDLGLEILDRALTDCA